MIRSMTGFGTAKVELPYGTILNCYIKTLNHKYLDIHISLPQTLNPYESKIMKRLKNSFKRGRVEANLYVETNQNNVKKLKIDFQRAEEYYNLLLRLKKRFGIDENVDITLLSNFKDIFIENNFPRLADKTILTSLKKLLDDSINRVQVMRMEEGKAIYDDFKKRLKNFKKHLAVIKKKAEKNIPLWRERARKNIKAFGEGINLNENRLEQEILLFALKSDITEECARLESHISQFEMFLEKDEAIGKKLNFLLQEMTRETNTLCVKAVNIDIQKRGVQIREEIEHLREQAYNIE